MSYFLPVLTVDAAGFYETLVGNQLLNHVYYYNDSRVQNKKCIFYHLLLFYTSWNNFKINTHMKKKKTCKIWLRKVLHLVTLHKNSRTYRIITWCTMDLHFLGYCLRFLWLLSDKSWSFTVCEKWTMEIKPQQYIT